MNRSRLTGLAVFAAALVAVAVEPVAAQSAADSTSEELIGNLNSQLLYVAVPVTVLVEAILVYTVWRYRNNENPLPTRENRRLEISWTVVTALILLFVGVVSYQVMASPYVTANAPDAGNEVAEDGEPLEVQVVAQKYYWTFEYPGQNVTTRDTMVLPVDRTVRLNVSSRDWLHAVHIPELGVKQDAFPGQSNYEVTEVHSTGEYQLYCAEYCGVGHSGMLATVDVRSQDGFQSWVAENSGEAAEAETGNGTGEAETS